MVYKITDLHSKQRKMNSFKQWIKGDRACETRGHLLGPLYCLQASQSLKKVPVINKTANLLFLNL